MAESGRFPYPDLIRSALLLWPREAKLWWTDALAEKLAHIIINGDGVRKRPSSSAPDQGTRHSGTA